MSFRDTPGVQVRFDGYSFHCHDLLGGVVGGGGWEWELFLRTNDNQSDYGDFE